MKSKVKKLLNSSNKKDKGQATLFFLVLLIQLLFAVTTAIHSIRQQQIKIRMSLRQASQGQTFLETTVWILLFFSITVSTIKMISFHYTQLYQLTQKEKRSYE